MGFEEGEGTAGVLPTPRTQQQLLHGLSTPAVALIAVAGCLDTWLLLLKQHCKIAFAARVRTPQVWVSDFGAPPKLEPRAGATLTHL